LIRPQNEKRTIGVISDIQKLNKLKRFKHLKKKVKLLAATIVWTSASEEEKIVNIVYKSCVVYEVGN
jgi:hypothetical protein